MATTLLLPYLFFGGRCDEALAFYRDAIGARVEFLMRHNEGPPAAPGVLAPGFEAKVCHATVRIGEATLLVSDGCDQTSKFDGFRLSLSLPDEASARGAFERLSEGGKVDMPLEKTFWSPCFGMVTDRFGLGWMVTVATATDAS